MVDIDAAIGFVVARGDQVDRARLSWLRSELPPPSDVVAKVEMGQTAEGGWPAAWGDLPSIDATCFRLAELDDLGALGRPAARQALEWLAGRQRPDGTWQEDEALAEVAPPWAKPGDPEASLYLTANAAFWLAIGGPIGAEPPPIGLTEMNPYAEVIARGIQAFRAALRPDGTWPSFLVAGWLGGALLYRAGWYYESAQIQVVLAERALDMSAADVAWMMAAFRRVGLSDQDYVMQVARRRLAETQGSDGGWESDDGPQFDVHTTLAAIRAAR
jgi:hypothetical protein